MAEIPVRGRLVSGANDKYVVHTHDIYDELLADKQSTINQIFKTNFENINNNNIKTIPSYSYSALKSLYDNSKLIPGQYYRMNDFTTIVNEAYTPNGTNVNIHSANHYFDLILLAIDTNKFSNIVAARPSSTNLDSATYFNKVNMSNWIIWYDINNDTTKYPWCNSNGKGIITRLIDDNNNDCDYDFKNIQIHFSVNDIWRYTIFFSNSMITGNNTADASSNKYITAKNNTIRAIHYINKTNEFQPIMISSNNTNTDINYNKIIQCKNIFIAGSYNNIKQCNSNANSYTINKSNIIDSTINANISNSKISKSIINGTITNSEIINSVFTGNCTDSYILSSKLKSRDNAVISNSHISNLKLANINGDNDWTYNSFSIKDSFISNLDGTDLIFPTSNNITFTISKSVINSLIISSIASDIRLLSFKIADSNINSSYFRRKGNINIKDSFMLQADITEGENISASYHVTKSILVNNATKRLVCENSVRPIINAVEEANIDYVRLENINGTNDNYDVTLNLEGNSYVYSVGNNINIEQR